MNKSKAQMKDDALEIMNLLGIDYHFDGRMITAVVNGVSAGTMTPEAWLDHLRSLLPQVRR